MNIYRGMFAQSAIAVLLAYIIYFVVVLIAASPDSTQARHHSTHPPAAQAGQPHPRNLPQLMQAAQQQGSVRVIVGLDVPTVPEGTLDRPQQVNQQRDAIRQAQRGLLASLSTHNVGAVTQFETIPFVALSVDAAALNDLANDPAVTSIEEDVAEPPLMAESLTAINAPDAWDAGYTGLGVAVAVIDTGADTDHSLLADNIVAEGCFNTNDIQQNISARCPDGVEELIAPGAAEDCDPSINGCGHGSHVAGTIAGARGVPAAPVGVSGVAPDAGLIVLQTFSLFDDTSQCGGNAPCVLSLFSDQIRALEYLLQLHNDPNFPVPIAAVNMSLGSGRFGSQQECDQSNPSRFAAIENLRSVGIATLAAAGNNGYTNALNRPGCFSNVIAVGATGDGSGTTPLDAIMTTSNSAEFLGLLAPGEQIVSAVPDDAYGVKQGTSMAAPHVAGAWAVMRQKFPGASVAQVLESLQRTGFLRIDTRYGAELRVTPLIQLDAALDALDETTLEPTLSPLEPTGLTAELLSPFQVRLTWRETSYNERAFRLENREDGADWQPVTLTDANVVAYTHTASCGIAQQYRVQAENAHGLSGFSEVISMTPGISTTAADAYTGAAVPITDGMTTTVAVDVADAGALLDLDVRLDLTHSNVEQLDIALESPAGTRVELVRGEDISGSDFAGTVFDDEAGTVLAAASAPFAGRFRPDEALNALDSQPIAGDWTLLVADTGAGDEGAITGVGLNMTYTLTDTAQCPNNPPRFTAGPGQIALEDSATQTVTNWATDLAPGPAYESAQEPAAFEVSSDNTDLFVQDPVISTTGTLTYTPAADAYGTATVAVRLRDNGGTTDGGQDTSPTQTFTITLLPVNDPPTFTRGRNQVLIANWSPQIVANWATNSAPGPDNEAGQPLNFLVTTDTPELFAVPPVITPEGTLTYTPLEGVEGTASVTVRLRDKGGTLNGGEDTSASQTFTITMSREARVYLPLVAR